MMLGWPRPSCDVVVLSLALLALPAAAQERTRGAGASKPPASDDAGVADVKLDSLRRPTATPAKTGRNPFRFHEPPPPPPRRVVAPPVAPPVYVPPVPVGPPPPPPITLRFIGLIEAPQRSGRVALLSDGRGGLMNGREGDVLEGRYRILRVGTDSMDLAYMDGRGRQTIRLSGQ